MQDSGKHYRIEVLTKCGWVAADTIYAEWREAFTDMQNSQSLFPKSIYRIREVGSGS